ncbi:isomerase [Cordylochernes scorpioides]|uniref:Isomerase n=1 Tax=Cordylochernes scorpioides TaxID=51811 RepID=A0ABY6KXM5_9ARAC|nr:isomerase [Cordylochernes scorpioides]
MVEFYLSDVSQLWMGVHPSGPSVIRASGETLASYVERDPATLGAAVRHLYGSLPFLFKVLSVRQPLSIQAHPTKTYSRNESRHGAWKFHHLIVQEHAKILNQERPDLYPDPNHKPEIAIALTHFRALCGFRPYEEIVSFSTGGDHTGMGTAERDLVLELHGWYPGDIGCLAAFFLNQILLLPGQAIYLPPNVPHAYLQGGEPLINLLEECLALLRVDD